MNDGGHGLSNRSLSLEFSIRFVWNNAVGTRGELT